MDISGITQKLANTDSLEDWRTVASALDVASKQAAYRQAKPLWVKRMVEQRKLLLHPEVIENLRYNQWVPSDVQLRMIWASVLATLDEPNSKEGFNRIKERLRKKYGYSWWEDVYKRIKPAYAARERIKKKCAGDSQAMQMLAHKTILFGSMFEEEYISALEMIPRD